MTAKPTRCNKFDDPLHRAKHRLGRLQFDYDQLEEKYEHMKKQMAQFQLVNEHQAERIIQLQNEIRILRENQRPCIRQHGKTMLEGYFTYLGREYTVGPYKTEAEVLEAVEQAKKAIAE
ncbi:hypothetical protein [Pseudobacillus badius]|uniref:hypothetical protein n=1 Tax=Bacillus badius TaxID=1455 RepID=UPI00249FC7A8|nr:hypothetical protein [Bacillus badius]GLY11353.1 hypothetical protein Bbad01_25690 [Bacillus badius]